MTDHDEHGAITSTWADDARRVGDHAVTGRQVQVFEDGCVRTTDYDDDGYPIETWT